MPNFPGATAFPVYVNATPIVDAAYYTLHQQTGLARGGAAADYNVKLRGLGKRIDKKPLPPYP